MQVLSAAHCFKELKKNEEVTLYFTNGKQLVIKRQNIKYPDRFIDANDIAIITMTEPTDITALNLGCRSLFKNKLRRHVLGLEKQEYKIEEFMNHIMRVQAIFKSDAKECESGDVLCVELYDGLTMRMSEGDSGKQILQ